MCVYVCEYAFTNPSLRAGCDTRSGFNRISTGLIQGFLSPRPAAIPKLNNTACIAIYPELEREELESFIAHVYLHNVQLKRRHRGFELSSLYLFPSTITPQAPPNVCWIVLVMCFQSTGIQRGFRRSQ